MPYGRVKWYNGDRGYRFVEVEDERDGFLHHGRVSGFAESPERAVRESAWKFIQGEMSSGDCYGTAVSSPAYYDVVRYQRPLDSESRPR